MSNNVTLYAFDAENGDCLLLINNNTGFSILIDSGPNKKIVSERLITSIKNVLINDFIDLAIITHNDDDHIGGFKSFLKKDITINNFIFNSYDYIKKIIPSPRNTKISLKQDKDLFKNIENKIINLELTENGYFSDINIDIFNIKFRSPNLDKLNKYRSWTNKEEKKLRNKKISKSSISITNDECIKRASNDIYFKEDTREPNGSSLALDIAFGTSRILLLGDAHPSVVINSLIQDNEEITKYDLIKISHHGSEKNTSNSLLKLIDCDNYLICSNAKNSHGHPSPVSLKRIINNNEHAKIYVTKNNSEMKEIESTFNFNFIYPLNSILEFKYEF